MTCAVLPAEVAASGYEPRLVATLRLLAGFYRQSKRQTQQVLENFYQVEVALGTINKLRPEVSEAVAEPVSEATEFAQA